MGAGVLLAQYTMEGENGY